MYQSTKKICIFSKLALNNCLFFISLSFLLYLSACKNNSLPQIGEQIRTERLKQNISQIQLAEAIDMEISSLSLIEDGLATPIKEKIKAIEEHLNTTFVWDSTAIDLPLQN